MREEATEVIRKTPDLTVPLIVTDDYISGTFTFVRSLEDNAYHADFGVGDPERAASAIADA